jgi:hypothetical protein
VRHQLKKKRAARRRPVPKARRPLALPCLALHSPPDRRQCGKVRPTLLKPLATGLWTLDPLGALVARRSALALLVWDTGSLTWLEGCHGNGERQAETSQSVAPNAFFHRLLDG